jgi:hypothetical protein
MFVETMGGERTTPYIVSSSALCIEVYRLVNIQEESGLEMWEWPLTSNNSKKVRRNCLQNTSRLYHAILTTDNRLDSKDTEVEIMQSCETW